MRAISEKHLGQEGVCSNWACHGLQSHCPRAQTQATNGLCLPTLTSLFLFSFQMVANTLKIRFHIKNPNYLLLFEKFKDLAGPGYLLAWQLPARAEKPRPWRLCVHSSWLLPDSSVLLAALPAPEPPVGWLVGWLVCLTQYLGKLLALRMHAIVVSCLPSTCEVLDLISDTRKEHHCVWLCW